MLFNLFTPSYPVVDVNIPEGWWKSDSQLDIDFANNRSFNRKTAYKGRPSELLTYTSPSPKMVFSESGVLKYAPHNLLTYSQEFDNAAWTVTQATITANSTTAPDRTLTADTLNDVNAGTYAELRRTDNVAFVSGHTYSVSVYLKQNTKRYASLALHSVYFGANVYAFFDLQTGTIKETGLGAAVVGSEISDAGNGWYRCTLKATATASGNGRLYIYPMNDAGTSINYTGTGASALYVWGTQINRGSVVLDYLATTSAAKYDLPIDYHPTTHAALGVLIEEQRTNLLTYSQEFDNAAWTKSRATVTANAAVAPDGTTTADKLIPTAVSNTHRMYQGSITHGVLRTYTYTCYLKAAEYTKARLAITDATEADAAHCAFDLTDGTLAGIAQAFGTFSAASASVVDCGDGWYHCTLIATCDATEATVTAWVASGNASGGLSFTGDGTSGIYVWGAQLEAGAFATSYIQTGSAQVTRASDNITLATSAFNFSGATSTILAESDVDNLIGTHHVFSLHDGSNNERCVLRSIDAAMNYAISDGGVLQASNNVPGTVQARQMQSVAFAFAVNDIALSMDGGSITSDTSATLPTVTTLSLGASYYTGLDQLNGHIKRIVVWNTRKSNAELQGLSA